MCVSHVQYLQSVLTSVDEPSTSQAVSRDEPSTSQGISQKGPSTSHSASREVCTSHGLDSVCVGKTLLHHLITSIYFCEIFWYTCVDFSSVAYMSGLNTYLLLWYKRLKEKGALCGTISELVTKLSLTSWLVLSKLWLWSMGNARLTKIKSSSRG